MESMWDKSALAKTADQKIMEHFIMYFYSLRKYSVYTALVWHAANKS